VDRVLGTSTARHLDLVHLTRESAHPHITHFARDML
jgi:hypothetical protein